MTSEIIAKEYMRQYQKKNKHKWYEKKKCLECSGSYTSCNYTNHKKSKKHECALIKKENEELQAIKKIMIATRD